MVYVQIQILLKAYHQMSGGAVFTFQSNIITTMKRTENYKHITVL